MSSILRALKKLENDPRHLGEPRTLDSKFVPLADTGQQKKSTGLFMLIIGGGLICGLVVLAGWWALSEKTRQTPVAAPQISRQNLQQPEVEPTIPEKSVTSQEPEPAASKDISPEPARPPADVAASRQTKDHSPEPASTLLSKPSVRSNEQKTVLPPVKKAVESSAQLSETQNTAAATPVSAEKEVAADTSPPAISLNNTGKVEIPLLNDPKMKLQAITWSKEPHKRIAVINNSILRQGEAVAGYRIDAINQDDVVLTERGRKWKLIFRIR